MGRSVSTTKNQRKLSKFCSVNLSIDNLINSEKDQLNSSKKDFDNKSPFKHTKKFFENLDQNRINIINDNLSELIKFTKLTGNYKEIEDSIVKNKLSELISPPLNYHNLRSSNKSANLNSENSSILNSENSSILNSENSSNLNSDNSSNLILSNKSSNQNPINRLNLRSKKSLSNLNLNSSSLNLRSSKRLSNLNSNSSSLNLRSSKRLSNLNSNSSSLNKNKSSENSNTKIIRQKSSSYSNIYCKSNNLSNNSIDLKKSEKIDQSSYSYQKSSKGETYKSPDISTTNSKSIKLPIKLPNKTTKSSNPRLNRSSNDSDTDSVIKKSSNANLNRMNNSKIPDDQLFPNRPRKIQSSSFAQDEYMNEHDVGDASTISQRITKSQEEALGMAYDAINENSPILQRSSVSPQESLTISNEEPESQPKQKLKRLSNLNESTPNKRFKYQTNLNLKKIQFELPSEMILNILYLKDENMNLFQFLSMRDPIVVENPINLGIKLPDNLTENYFIEKLGPNYSINIIKSNGKCKKIKLKEFINTIDECTKIMNLDLSKTVLNNEFEVPDIIRRLTKDQNDMKISKNCQILKEDSFIDFHNNFTQSIEWYHLVDGAVLFCFVEPTAKNLKSYQEWLINDNRDDICFLDTLDVKYQQLMLKKGETIFLPSNMIYAIYAIQKSILFSGDLYPADLLLTSDKLKNKYTDDYLDYQSRFPLSKSDYVKKVKTVIDLQENDEIINLINKMKN